MIIECLLRTPNFLPQVIYLGLSIPAQHCAIALDRKDLISFLGLAGFFRIWVPNFNILARPLYQASKIPSIELLDPSININLYFWKLQQVLISAPALALPNLIKPFTEREGIALRLLGQVQEPDTRVVTYLSKQLDTTIRGWPACLSVG